MSTENIQQQEQENKYNPTPAEMEAEALADAALEVDLNRTYSIDQFLYLSVPDILKNCELVKGKIVHRSCFWAGTLACEVANNLYSDLLMHTYKKLGLALCCVGVVFDPDPLLPTVRTPRYSFLAKGRKNELTDEQKARAAKHFEYYLQVIPDLTIEFFQSDRDNWTEMRERIEQYMSGGVKLCWLVDIDARTAYIFRQGTSEVETVGYDGALDGENIVPGFHVTLKELYEREW